MTTNVTVDSRILDAMAEIKEACAEIPNAICPTPRELVAIWDMGFAWDYELGQPDTERQWEDLGKARFFPATTEEDEEDGPIQRYVRIPVLGTISKHGIELFVDVDLAE